MDSRRPQTTRSSVEVAYSQRIGPAVGIPLSVLAEYCIPGAQSVARLVYVARRAFDDPALRGRCDARP